MAKDPDTVFMAYLSMREGIAKTMSEYYCVLFMDKSLKLWPNKSLFDTGALPKSTLEVSRVEEWDGKTAIKNYEHSFRIRLVNGKSKDCSAVNRNDQIKWMRYVTAVGDPSSEEGRRLKYLKKKEEQDRKEETRKRLAQRPSSYGKNKSNARSEKDQERVRHLREQDSKAMQEHVKAPESAAMAAITDPNRRKLLTRNQRKYRNEMKEKEKEKERRAAEKEKEKEKEARRKEKQKQKQKKREERQEQEGSVHSSASSASRHRSRTGKSRAPSQASKSDRSGYDSSSSTSTSNTDPQSKTQIGDTRSGEPMLKEDPQFAAYFRLLHLGLPPEAVRQKMAMEGADASVLDLDPMLPLSQQRS